jgi:hypothetical protein
LVRKPGAFENYCYRKDLFLTSRFGIAQDALQNTFARKPAPGTLATSNAATVTASVTSV